MNWFSGTLQVQLTNGDLATYHDVSLRKAQDILDSLPKDDVREATYTPYAISMVPSR